MPKFCLLARARESDGPSRSWRLSPICPTWCQFPNTSQHPLRFLKPAHMLTFSQSDETLSSSCPGLVEVGAKTRAMGGNKQQEEMHSDHERRGRSGERRLVFGFGQDAGARMETSNKGRALGSPKKGFGRGREEEPHRESKET